MAKRYSLNHCMSLIDPQVFAEDPQSCFPLVGVYGQNDFQESSIPDAGKEAIEALLLAESNYCEIFSDYIVGSLAVVNKVSETADPNLLAYYLDSNRLVILDDTHIAEDILDRIAKTGACSVTTGHVLYLFLKLLLMDDLKFLDAMEDEMEPLEERLLQTKDEITTTDIMVYRRIAMLLSDHYQQLSTMADTISDNENKLLSRADARSFDRIATLADRLATRAESVKEYSLQLHELYQTRLQIRQNTIMQTFTIVTVIFAPLTLITGWFGMNLSTLPGVDWPYMSFALLSGGILFTIIAIIVMRLKHWV